MDDLLADFVAESREMLEALGGEIVAWEADPADRSRLDSIFRFVHTVKGNCGFFDFPRLQALSHAAEDALADVRAGRRNADGKLVSAVLAIIDRIGDMVDAIEGGQEFPEGGDEPLILALAPDADAADAIVPVAQVGNGSAGKAVAAQRSIRLPIELLDRVMSGVSDMVLARNDLARRLRDSESETAIEGPFERLSSIIADVRDAITRTRMQRIETLFTALPRLVRDLSAELGKQVMVDIDGGEVELDREMIEIIRDPLTHIIRNAVDHGMEKPADRLAAGKREIGLLSVSARQSGNQILIDVVDDGRGIDGTRLVEKAVAAGLVDAAEGQRLSPRERFALIFEPGLSTADKVTSISGRGVGMDVVRSNVERIGGAIEIDSTAGRGTRMTLRVPLTLTIIPALTVSIGAQRFAIPRSSIEEIVHASEGAIEISRLGGAMLARIRNRRLPCLALASVLGLPSTVRDEDRTLIVLRLAAGELFALTVDRLHDHEELVVKPVAPAVMATGVYAGTTLTDEGDPILLLEVAGLAQAGGLKLEGQDRSALIGPSEAETRAAQATPVFLFTALDGRRRAIRMGLVDRIEEVEEGAVDISGDETRVVIGERILPLTGVNQTQAREVRRLFRLSDGATDVGYAFNQVLDIKAIDGEIVRAETPGEIEGITLIDGEPVELIDAFWLFARHAAAAAASSVPVCRLPADDAWMQNFLRPLIEAAGYRVIGDADEGEADIAIATPGNDSAAAKAGQVIWLRAAPDQTSGMPDSVYRYDREGLMAALRVAGGRGR
jgi:two-component system chemotaxis sensor kinase CheA